jgi:hypothetical protein
LALFVSVGARQLRAEFLLPRPSQMPNPVGNGVEAFLDLGPLQPVAAQVGADAERPVTPRRMIRHEILGEAPVIEQFFRAQSIEQRRNDYRIVTFLEQFTAQIVGRVVATSEGIERRDAGRPCIERLDLLAAQGVTPL